MTRRRSFRPPSENGCGLDAVWADDFHHHIRRLLTGGADGYFESYPGTTAALADTVEYGWFFAGSGRHTMAASEAP